MRRGCDGRRGRTAPRWRLADLGLEDRIARGRGDRIAIGVYLGRGDVFDQAIADFSAVYGDQSERDYEALAQAVKSSRIPAETGV